MFYMSDEVIEYKKRVEKETDKEIKITLQPNLDLGMLASYSFNPDYIDVNLNQNINPKISVEDIEQSLEHEFTHGLLNHKMKYAYLKEKKDLTNKENIILGALGTMVEDIVVNKLLQDSNLKPYPSIYISELKKEIRVITKRFQYYTKSARPEFADTEIRDRFMIQRYICVWGSKEYLKVNNLTRIIFRDYLRAFENNYAQQYKEVQRVKELISQNNLFTREGHYKVMDECIKMWELTDVVELLFPE